jgi:hypothetical protein
VGSLKRSLWWCSVWMGVAAIGLCGGQARAAVAPTTTRVSVGTGGTQGNAAGRILALSGDGGLALFWSRSSNLVDGDTNRIADLFIHDQVAGTTERVDVGGGGVQANGAEDGATMTPDGRYVAFNSRASNLRTGKQDRNHSFDVYLRDRVRGVTMLVSKRRNGKMFPLGALLGSISSDGRFIVFKADRVRRPHRSCVYLRDRSKHTTIQVACLGRWEDRFDALESAIVSDDGRYVVWSTYLGYANISDRRLDKTRQPPHKTLGCAQLDDMTPDAQYLVFTSSMTCDWDDARIVVWNRLTGDVTDVSGTPTDSGTFGGGSISSDGRYVLFWSLASDLIANDTNNAADAFVRDLQTGTIVRVSVAADGSQDPEDAYSAALSDDGRFAGFSTAGALVPDDTNHATDGYIRGPLR